MKKIEKFDLAKAADELAQNMRWNCIAIPHNSEENIEECGIIIGTKEWVEKVLDGEEEVTILTKDFSPNKLN